MTNDSFIIRLSSSYEIKEVMQDDIREWINQKDIEGQDVQYLYNAIIRRHKYKTLNLAAIVDFWEKCSDEISRRQAPTKENIYSEEFVFSYSKDWPVEKIYNKCCEIKNLQKDDVKLLSKQISFFSTWESVYSEWLIGEDKKWSKNDIIHHCERVKNDRENGEKHFFAVKKEQSRQKQFKSFDELKVIEKTLF